MKRLNLLLLSLICFLHCSAQNLYVYDAFPCKYEEKDESVKQAARTLGEETKKKYPDAVDISTLNLSSRNGYKEIILVGKFVNWSNDFANECKTKNSIVKIDMSNADLSGLDNWYFKQFPNLETLIFPETAHYYIPANSLQELSNISELSFKENCDGIGSQAFSNATALKKVTFYEGMGKIEKEAFVNAKAISRVQIKVDINDTDCNKTIDCALMAFDYDVLDKQTATGGKTAFMMIGDNEQVIEASEDKKQYYTGNPVAVNPNVQNSLLAYRNAASNGWQQFIWNNGQQKLNSEEIPLSTFSINRKMSFYAYDPANYPLSVYKVAIKNDHGKEIVQLQMINGSDSVVLAPNTAVLIYSPKEFIYNASAEYKYGQPGDYSSQLIPLCVNDKNVIYNKENDGVRNWYSFFLCKASQTRYAKYWKDENGKGGEDYFSFFGAISGIYSKCNKGYLKLPEGYCTDKIRRIGFDLQTNLDICLAEYQKLNIKDDLEYHPSNDGIDAGFSLSKGGFTYDLGTYDEEQIISGITSVEDNSKNDDYYYSLSGIKTTNPSHGIFIHNGKKVFIK